MYFTDILDCSDKRMGCEYDEPRKNEKIKLLSLKAKSRAKGVELSQSQDMENDGKGGVVFKHKSELKADVCS